MGQQRVGGGAFLTGKSRCLPRTLRTTGLVPSPHYWEVMLGVGYSACRTVGVGSGQCVWVLTLGQVEVRRKSKLQLSHFPDRFPGAERG